MFFPVIIYFLQKNIISQVKISFDKRWPKRLKCVQTKIDSTRSTTTDCLCALLCPCYFAIASEEERELGIFKALPECATMNPDHSSGAPMTPGSERSVEGLSAGSTSENALTNDTSLTGLVATE